MISQGQTGGGPSEEKAAAASRDLRGEGPSLWPYPPTVFAEIRFLVAPRLTTCEKTGEVLPTNVPPP